ncbi:MAG: hypothetical protein HZB65_01320 [Candidatus Aenigmarchaeota archaeon]|nr:hypothetical protein [Candidatus Aenigmarchaeota archaeon]
MPDYVAIPSETFLRYTKHIQNKDILDSKGRKIGRVNDLVLGNLDANPHIEGILSEKTFIPWSLIAGFGEYVMLNKRLFEISGHELDASKILLCKQLLDEQLIDEQGMNIGRIDDIALMYSNKERNLKVSGICTGIQIRVGIQKYYDIIPWKNVRGFQQRPSALIVKPGRASCSHTSKALVYLRE